MARDLVPNPPWASAAIADAYESIQRKFHNQPLYLPEFSAVWPSTEERGAITAIVQEYGCGVYGCVYPTLDPRTVIKVTTDDTEAQFAQKYANNLVKPICVHYRAAMPLGHKHDGREIYLLWRESAEHVGGIVEYISTHRGLDEDDIYEAIGVQHSAAQIAYGAFIDAKGRWNRVLESAILRWLAGCEQMSRIPELSTIGHGMVEVYAEQGILFGDIHDGNIGMVTREGRPTWVITDPGHIGVVRR